MQIAPSAIDPGHVYQPVPPPSGPVEPPRRGSGPRRRPKRLRTLLAMVVVFGAAGAAGVLVTANQQADRISRIPGLNLSPSTGNVENFLLVGSDSREGADPSDPDFGAIGGTDQVTGNRSDTVMILRRDLDGGPAALLSLPRDLCIDLPDCNHPRRINAAFQDGPQGLIDVVTGTFGIPIQHYVEIDFQGFKSLVDAIGGVEVCSWTPIRDTHTGLDVDQPGCHTLDGLQGLAYARSRHFETYDVNTDTWTEDPASDFGRIERQQAFIETVLEGAVAKVKGNPLSAGEVMTSITGALTMDDGLDVIAAAGAMREAVGGGLAKFTIPVRGKTVDGNAMLVLADEFQAYIDYFRGVSNTPPAANP